MRIDPCWDWFFWRVQNPHKSDQLLRIENHCPHATPPQLPTTSSDELNAGYPFSQDVDNCPHHPETKQLDKPQRNEKDKVEVKTLPCWECR
jgi:hypothetical protein